MATHSPSPAPRQLDAPELPRVLPFALFLLLTGLQGKLFPGSEYWIYAAKGVLAGAILWSWRGRILEMRWACSWEAIVVGLGIAGLWIGLDGRIPSLDRIWGWGRNLVVGTPIPAIESDKPWNPVAYFSGNSALGWGFVGVRFFIRSIVVPPLEEVFYRSFFYRFIAQSNFMAMPLGTWNLTAFVVTVAAFGLAHPGQWLAGIFCGAAFQWLTLRKKRLGDAMTAHAITNFGVGVWAISTGNWQFT